MSSDDKYDAVPTKASPYVESTDVESSPHYYLIQPQSSPDLHQQAKQGEKTVPIDTLPTDSPLLSEEYGWDEKEKSRKADIIMFISLLLGSMLALMHSIMNYELNHKTVTSIGISQQWISFCGTAIAFLTLTFFASCIRVVFVQRQWLNISTHRLANWKQDFDVLSTVLLTPFSLFKSRIWSKYPRLFVIALLSWIIPFAAIITPGTLLVEFQPTVDSGGPQTPRLSTDYHPFTSSVGTSGIMDKEGTSTNWFVVDASQELSRLTHATAASSQIIPMSPGFVNQTDPSMTFLGPALKCVDANKTMSTLVSDYANSQFVHFLAWAGETPPWRRGSGPDIPLQGLQFYLLDQQSMQPNQTKENVLWIASALGSHRDRSFALDVARCSLWNASYEVELSYPNFEQISTIKRITYHNTVLTSTFKGEKFSIPSPTLDISIPYRAVMSTIDSLLVGVLPSSGTRKSNQDLLNIDFTNFELTKSGLEDFSHNLTLSLFSVPAFIANKTDTSLTTGSSIYVYNQRDLLPAYGLAFLVSAVCCMVGLYGTYKNRGTFRGDSSDDIPTAGYSDLDPKAAPTSEDTGAEPLLKKYR